MISKLRDKALFFFKDNKDSSFSFIFYGFGLMGMLLSDLYVSSNFSIQATAEWAFLKSTILIVSTICLVGYDQLFVRDQTLIKRYFKFFLKYSFFIISTLLLIVFFLKSYTYDKIILLGCAVFLMAIQNYISAASRANYRLWKAQFSANFWKLLLFITIILIPEIDTIYYYVIVLLFTVSVGLFLGGVKKVSDKYASKEHLDDKTANNMGFSFLLHNLTLVLAIYGEQFLINLFGAEVSSSHLFRYVAVFTPIALSLNGFLGFYLGPKIRIKNNMDLTKYKKFVLHIFFFSIAVVSVSFIFGLGYMTKILGVNWQDLDYFIIICLFGLTMVRGLYIATSVCLGVFGTKIYLKKAAIYTWFATILYLIMISVVLFIYEGIIVAQLICLLTFVNWILRFTVSNIYTKKTLKIR